MKRLFAILFLPLLLLTGCNNVKPSDNTSSSQNEEIIEATTKYTKKSVTIKRDNLKIAGEFYTPTNSKTVFPLLVLSHGFNENMDNTRNNAISFTKTGFATFIFDFIGGGSNIKSDGKLTEMSVLTEAADLNVVIERFKAEPSIDASRIFLLGQSQGGFVSTYVASTRNDIKGLIGFYPAYVLQDDALKQYSKLEDVPATYASPIGPQIGRIYWQDATSFDIYEVMKNYQRNVLLIHGTSDNIVPISYAQRAQKTFPHAELLMINGAGHGFSGNDLTKAMKASKDYLKNNL